MVLGLGSCCWPEGGFFFRRSDIFCDFNASKLTPPIASDWMLF
jgi:hypothetical protein